MGERGKEREEENGKRNHCRIFYLDVLIITKLSSLNTYVHPIYQTYHIIKSKARFPPFMVCKGEGVDLVFLLMFSPLNRKLHFVPSRFSHIYHKSRPLKTYRCPTANNVNDALAAPRRVRRRCPFCSVSRYNLAS